jgi:hypothetical protein
MKIPFLFLLTPACFFTFLGCKPEVKTGNTDSELLSIHQTRLLLMLWPGNKNSNCNQISSWITNSLWATDSLAPDPVGMDIDIDNNVYLTRTNRQKNSEFDIRGYPHWMTPSIALQSVEDRRAFLHKTFAPEKSEENKWLPDLNNDSIHDWHDLAVEKEEVWRLTDKDGDGMADVSTRVINDFNDEVTDILAGILVREKDMFLTVGPDVWHLEDMNGDGIMDKKLLFPQDILFILDSVVIIFLEL